MTFDSESIRWDHPVEMFEAGPGIVVNRREMTLRQAVEHVRDMPADLRSGYGVGMHEMMLASIHGRPVAIGFLNASTLARMIPLLPQDGHRPD